MSKRFPYGYEIEPYIDKALERLKEVYPWAKKSMLKKEYSYSIEKINGKFKPVSVYKWDEDSITRNEYDFDGEGLIDLIYNDNEFWIKSSNEIDEIYDIIDKVLVDGPININGWYLEKYEFRKHKLGGYSIFLEAGNRSAGSSRTEFLPENFFKGTFDDFLDKYMELIPAHFGFNKEELKTAKGLNEFLGFKE